MTMEDFPPVERLRTLKKQLGHDPHPITALMAGCPPLDHETGLPLNIHKRMDMSLEMATTSARKEIVLSPILEDQPEVQMEMESPQSPSVLSLNSLDEYLSSSEISSYQPLEVSQTLVLFF